MVSINNSGLVLDLFRPVPPGAADTPAKAPNGRAPDPLEKTRQLRETVNGTTAATGVRMFRGEPLTEPDKPVYIDPATGREEPVEATADGIRVSMEQHMQYFKSGVRTLNNTREWLTRSELRAQLSESDIAAYEKLLPRLEELHKNGVKFFQDFFRAEGTIVTETPDRRLSVGSFTLNYVGDGYRVSVSSSGASTVVIGSRSETTGGLNLRV